MAETVKLAVLIDADNAKAEHVELLLAEIAKYGVASVKRAYGNWTTPALGGWKQVLVEQSIQPMQQFSYTTGKNSTDSALIIDAMDLLYTGRFGGFCLISSDSDFTRLAQRIREAGLLVYGFGERKTPASLVAACDKFIYMDVLREAPNPAAGGNGEARPKSLGDLRQNKKLMQIFKAAVDAAGDDEGWANLGAVGNHVSKRAPDFDPRTWGYKKLSELLRALGSFEWEERKSADGRGKAMLLRHRGGGGSAPAPAPVPAQSQPQPQQRSHPTPQSQPQQQARPQVERQQPKQEGKAPASSPQAVPPASGFMPGLLSPAVSPTASAAAAPQPSAPLPTWTPPPRPPRQQPKQAPAAEASPAPVPEAAPPQPAAAASVAKKPAAKRAPKASAAAKPKAKPKAAAAKAPPTE